jgi:hypothetical protein
MPFNLFTIEVAPLAGPAGTRLARNDLVGE